METQGHWSFIPFGISQDFSLKSRFPLANVEGSSNSELLFGPDIGEMLQLVQLIRLFTFGARGWDTCILLYNSLRGIETYTGESIGEFNNCSLIDLIGCRSRTIYIYIYFEPLWLGWMICFHIFSFELDVVWSLWGSISLAHSMESALQ